MGMRFRQCIPDIYGDADSGIDRDMRMRIDVLFQCLPFHIFHDDVVIPLTASHIINPNNVRMAQFTRRLRFSPKTSNKFVIFSKITVQDFYCHFPVKQKVFGQIYIRHAPCANFPDQLITVIEYFINHDCHLLHFAMIHYTL